MASVVSPSSSRRSTPRRGRTASAAAAAKPVSPGHLSNVSDVVPDERTRTFTSSLSIAVEGAVPIEASTGIISSMPSLSPSQPLSETKRAPRKSKTDALAALNIRSRSPSFGADETMATQIEPRFPSHTVQATPPIPVSTALDMSTVKTSSPRNLPPRTKSRPFDLEDAPTFYPSPEEFKDPMVYIRNIAPKADKCGMAKIVPPIGWKMPFVTDTESFRFKTRVQRLNAIEASSRAKLNFLEALYRFHKQQGNPRVAVPTINHRPLDLWSLRKEVQKLGGFELVSKGKKWSEVGRVLGYGGIPGLSTQLRNSYVRIILPYEHFSEGARSSSTRSTSKARNAAMFNRERAQTPPPRSAVSASRFAESYSPRSNTSSPLSEPPDDLEVGDIGEPNFSTPKPRKSMRNGSMDTPSGKNIQGLNLSRSYSVDRLSSPTTGKDDDKDHKPELTCCEICHKKNRGSEMLLCDGCDCGFHTFCLNPPLDAVPNGPWFCSTCLCGTGRDFGFDEGEEHSLSSFQARDSAFRAMWFQNRPNKRQWSSDAMKDSEDPTVSTIGNTLVTEFDVEEEFWRLVQSPSEIVEIEYGADIHSTTHGSAMPTLETHPLDPYSRDAWNLNNIPILPDSLLRYIKSEINGMTVPWTYVGMIFSTFCWHNEDHYTYSVNYMHWGETKTWYSIPGSDAEKFEAAIKKEAPDLFEAQPDLLFQLVTLMNPGRLRESGVRVFACNQRAGEFVVTFPKAYHAGFNHGFNFNEAVNFALPDWLPYGRECEQRYQEHKKLPVFSMDELLITITQQSHSIHTAIWLNESFKEMVDRELNYRRIIRGTGSRNSGIQESIEELDRPEDQYQCTYCKAFCYLSQIVCSCSKASSKVACLEHAKHLCDCPLSHRVLRLRFADAELLNIKTTIATRAVIPQNWQNKLMKLLKESSRPPLRAMRALVAEADRINYPLKELPWLRRCLARANEWVEAANTFTTRKQSRKRSKRHRWQPALANGAGVSDDVTERPEKGLDELWELLKEVQDLGFDSLEISLLRNLAAQAEDFKAKAAVLLQSIPSEGDRSSFLQECETLLAHGSSLNVHLEELYKVENIVLQERLIKELDDVDESRLTLDEIRQFLTRAKACDLPPDSKYIKQLEAKLQAGNDWDERAANLLTQTVKTVDELDQFVEVESNIPVDPTVMSRIAAARSRALEFERQAKSWLMPESDAILPRVQDALRLVQRAEKEFDIPAIRDLKRTADFAYDLEERCESVLKNRYQHHDEGSVFEAMEKWRAYAKEHLTKFTLPNFEKLDKELDKHDEWFKKLPWYVSDYETSLVKGKAILKDVLDYTKEKDDGPPDDEFFTCICFDPVRPPPPGRQSDAVQCDHCFARFHGRCAANGGSCPFCDPNHWNGNIHRERSWHYCYLPRVVTDAPEITKNYSDIWKEVKQIVEHTERLVNVIGHFLSYASQPGNQRQEHIPQVRHYMRKLYKVQFAVSPNPEVSFGLDLAGLHRILASRPMPVRLKKRRRPRFVFGQDVDKDWTDGTRCICRGQTPYLRGFALIDCDICSRRYHAACVCYKGPLSQDSKTYFTCPLCCLRKIKQYRWADIRVRYNKDNEPPGVYVDVKASIESFSRELKRKALPPPVTPTIFIDLVQFTPGQPEGVAPRPSLPGNSQSNGSIHHPNRIPIHVLPHHSHPGTSASPIGSNVPPPPPWSRSESAASSSASAPDQLTAELHIPFKRKRKFSGLEDGRENVLVFEVDPQVPTGGPPGIHRGVHQANPTPLNIIMQNPSQMAAAQEAAAQRSKRSPTNHLPLPPSILPRQSTIPIQLTQLSPLPQRPQSSAHTISYLHASSASQHEIDQRSISRPHVVNPSLVRPPSVSSPSTSGSLMDSTRATTQSNAAASRKLVLQDPY